MPTDRFSGKLWSSSLPRLISIGPVPSRAANAFSCSYICLCIEYMEFSTCSLLALACRTAASLVLPALFSADRERMFSSQVAMVRRLISICWSSISRA